MTLADHLLRIGMQAAGLPSLERARAVGRALGRLAWRLDRRHRDIVRRNLAASFPEKDPAWVEATARACYQHLGQVAAEIPHLWRYGPQEIRARTRWATPEVVAELRRDLARGRGVFILTGHIGNWEWLNVAFCLEMGPAIVVARPIDWPPADRLVNQWRTKTGATMVPKAGSMRRLLAHARAGGVTGILLDQNVDWYDGVWVDFFGRPACTNKGLALLARKTGAAVYPGWCWRADDGMLEIHLAPEVPTRRTRDKTQDVWENTQRYTRALEDIIRRRPEQWFWVHQRWKTRPWQPWPRRKD